MMKIEATVKFKCPELEKEIEVPLSELDIDKDERYGVEIEVYCECKGFHYLKTD